MIKFRTQLYKIKDWTILRLPEDASLKLPTRGMTMVEGKLNGVYFKTLLEPDGRYGPGLKPSHWFAPENKLLKAAKATAGDTVEVELSQTKDWIKPDLPVDMKKAIIKDKNIHKFWNEITPLAQWDWVRWVRAVKTAETRQKHIEVMLDKMRKKMRRPCCFNRNLCSEPYVSKNWVLQGPIL